VDEDRKPLHAADWTIIAVYFLACIIVGLWVSLTLLSSFARHYTNGHICSVLVALQRGRLVVTRMIDPVNICQRGLCKSLNSARFRL